MRLPTLARAALLLYVLVPLVLVLGPLPRVGLDLWAELVLRVALEVPGRPWLPSRTEAEALANVLLFVPLGLLLPLAFPPLRLRAVAVGLVVLSAALELAQLLLVGRTSSPRDVLMNGTGGVAGVLLAGLARRRRPQPSR